MNQKIHDKTYAACQAGGMSSDASEECARDHATRNEGPKHTPGPWEQHGCAVYTSSKLPNHIANHDPITRLVAQASWDYDEEDVQHAWEYDEATANARLIAAAPDLLASLRECLHWIENSDDDGDGYNSTVAQNARAIIAKATEEEPR